MIRILFLVIASLGVLSALGVVLARNLVHAALYLVAFFFVIACLFVLLEVDFLAAIQVLVYIGAVAILILFGIMLTRNIQGDETTAGGPLRLIPAAVVAAALLGLLVVGIRREDGLGDRPSLTAIRERPDLLAAADAGAAAGQPADPRAVGLRETAWTVGAEMMTRYVVAFEAAGLLLTAALVGAIALAIGDRNVTMPGSTAESRGQPRSPDGNGDLPVGPHAPTPEATTTPASAPR